MGRSKYEAKRTIASVKWDKSQPRPKTPPWLRKTVFGRQRSKFVIGGGITLTILIITSITVGITAFTGSQKEQGNISVTPPTKQGESSTQESSTHGSRIQCENFQKRVRGFNGSVIILKNMFRERFTALVKEGVRDDEDKTIKEIKSFYKFCMNEDFIEEHGLKSLKGVIRKLGGWPMMDLQRDFGPCDSKSFCLEPWIKQKLRQCLISTWVVPCPSNKTYCIKLSSDFIMESIEQCEDPPNQESMCRNLRHVHKIFGSDNHTFIENCKSLIQRMQKKCRIASDPTFGDLQNMTMTIDKYEETYEIVMKLFRNTIPKSLRKTNHTVVFLQHPTAIRELLKAHGGPIINLAMWKFVNSLKLFLPKNLRENLYQPIVFGTLEHVGEQDRSEGCVNEIMSAYPSTSMTMYKMGYYNSETQKNVEQIFIDVKKGFNRILTKMNLMDNKTREELDSISLYTPKPERDILGNLTIYQDDPIRTVLNLKYFKFVRNFSYLEGDYHLEDEEYAKMDKDDPSPRYMGVLKKIYIPVKTLHMYFEKKRPDYMNYVALGFMMARQIALGFHHQWFGKNGNITRVKCFNELFSNHTTNHTNDEDKGETLNKVIADYMGLRAAYAAYDISINGNLSSNHPTYNHQLFWITAGNLFSNSDTVGSHLISHLDEFHRDFDCRIGSNMYPNKTCSLD